MKTKHTEIAMYLKLCGWSCVKSNETNPHWKGAYAWYHSDFIGYLSETKAYEFQKLKDEGYFQHER